MDLSALTRQLEARVIARMEHGDYEALDWLEAEVEIDLDPATPVDKYLQMPRPLAPWGRGAGSRASRARAKATRAALPELPGWEEASRDVDTLLREAIAWLRLGMLSEQWAREERDHQLAAGLFGIATRLDALAHQLAHLEHTTNNEHTPRIRTLEIDRALRRADDTLNPSARAEPPQPTHASQASATTTFDYLGFEDRFRGPEVEISARLAHHVPRLGGHGPVLDLGCGRGEFLRLLAEAGITAHGVDSDGPMAESARSAGLEVTTCDLFEALSATEPESLGAITAFHVIEHMSLDDQLRLIRHARRALREGGVLLLETPNPTSLVAGSINFLRDPTHIRPLHPDTLAFMMESEGFAATEIEFLAPVPPQFRVPRITGDSPITDEVNRALAVIDDTLFGSQDVAVIGTR